jgi:hypothetical protein
MAGRRRRRRLRLQRSQPAAGEDGALAAPASGTGDASLNAGPDRTWPSHKHIALLHGFKY